MAGLNALHIDLSDLAIEEDIEVLVQEGGRGMPEFAASTSACGTSQPQICEATQACSCTLAREATGST